MGLFAASVLLVPFVGAAATPGGKGFPSAEAAAKALVDAARSNNTADLMAILGPSAKSILDTGDRVADRKARRDFVERASEKMILKPYHGRQNEKMVVAGKDGWALPIPILEVNGQWYFDTAEAKQEMISRQIGSNELDAIEVCRGYVEAQNEYSEQNRTASNVPIYAQKIISSHGQHDGLYWPSTGDDNDSPMGDIVAKALAEGYTNKADPFHGYYFKVVTSQGPNAAGGAMSYIDNDLMTKGFALVAWPSNYGVTGIMTFVVDKTGIVYQKNLGRKTGEIAGAYSSYDPDKTWTPVKDLKLQSKK
jgi:hypothetical protein